MGRVVKVTIDVDPTAKPNRDLLHFAQHNPLGLFRMTPWCTAIAATPSPGVEPPIGAVVEPPSQRWGELMEAASSARQ